MSHYLLDVWLQGTTCFKHRVKRSVLFENNTHIVLKHNAHSEYVGRWRGSVNCGAYAVLFVKADLEKNSGHWGGLMAKPMKKWEGHINTETLKKDCKDLGVEF